MGPTRHSNAERRQRRDECRRELAQHIRIKIEPSEVRLTARATDVYSWLPVQGKEEIFSKVFSKVFAKSLSDHSVGTFRLLCSEVGESFEAVLARGKGATLDRIMPVSNPELCFSAIIDQLREENVRLCKQIEEVTRKVDAECKQKAIAEEKVHQFCGKQASLETQLREQADMTKLL
ncbi:hypothetical protein B0O99DRAFT_686779 [Bisporella sp. PMI_857]|nr:hypothetical protein B0O99DRAFT_686779 [Bisporella sp. PMI_857]